MSFDCLYGELPREKPMPVCPVCGEECNEVFVDYDNKIIGCETCIEWVKVDSDVKKISAWEYFKED